MTFKQIQDAVILNRFDESQRGDIKNWINLRYAQILAQEDWVFMQATAAVTVTSGSAVVTSLPATMGEILAFNRADGARLSYLTPAKYAETYYGQTATGKPVDYTVVNGAISVGPISSETSALYQLVYEKDGSPLSADTDVPVLPTSFHPVLVFGASAIGEKLQANFWASVDLEDEVDRVVESMRRRYLATRREAQLQSPAYRPY